MNWILIAIVVLGLGLRLWGVGFGLPYMYHPDEGVPVTIALRMLHTGNLDPNFFDWPSLIFYLNALVYLAYFLFGKMMGWFAIPTDLPVPDIQTIAVGKVLLLEEFLLGRGLTAVFGTLGVVAVYLVCREVSGSRIAGWLGALWFAVETVNIRHSQYIRPDTFLVTFALFSLWFAVRIADDPRLRNYILAGICAGLAISSKYNAALIVLPIAIAHFARLGVCGFVRKEIYLAALASLLAFFATTPYALLDWTRFWQVGILGNAAHYAGGHAGGEGDTLRWYLEFLWTTIGWLLPVALLESVWIVARREVRGIVLLTFPVVYFGFINLYIVRFESTILPVVAFVIILAARFIVRLYENISIRFIKAVVLVSVAMLYALPSARAAVEHNISILQPDTREEARMWLDGNLPPGTRVFVEPYSPYVDSARFIVMGDASIKYSLEWYVQNGFEYLVLSEGNYGRFFKNPERYGEAVQRYSDFFTRLSEVRRFSGNGPEIRVFKIQATSLPSHRIAARFGDYGELIELVGYDPTTSRVQPGESLHVRLFWRALKPANEPLELSLHLLNRDNQVTTVRGDLFQHKYSGWAWPEGIFSTEWTVPISANVEPGMYTLQVEVTQTRFAYTLPARTWAGELIPAVSLGMFKVGVPAPSAAELQAAHKTNVRWNDQIELIAYALDSRTTRAGDTLNITLYWRSIAKSDKEYTIFVHLLDAQGNVRAQRDAPPRAGTYPTSIWDVGEIVRDEYVLELPRDLVAGEYRLVVGLYEYPSLARLSVTDTIGNLLGDQFVLDEIIRITP